ncbi:AEL276Cp [Eremothecium gossypii ATCC 10895]|uniref:Glycogen debranching enzyme n=1 Tax=Eremothecium gossypii (strain ATCC 10895 / CBS 109.51 / FGSC 9923 / NRRL Y-1056) TaxID=284811 RepID=Q758N1_EREGS|nr:AEL276Cp [Eremothecium gossypii ATCC 10895]AAS52408.1 AEL276Cp [Eremothecium gossypii ATCC 10895]
MAVPKASSCMTSEASFRSQQRAQTAMKTVLLRLDDNGEPVRGEVGKGVLTLPCLPVGRDAGEDSGLRVRLVVAAGSPVTRDGLVWTNCPPERNTKFQRNKFYKHLLSAGFLEDSCVDVDVYVPGSYCYYVSFRNEREQLETTRRFYFVVPPVLSLGEQLVPMNTLAVQSVVSKWMGTDWEPIFRKISGKGYNMVHFTPLQARGESNSPYSIYDQLQFDLAHFHSAEDVSRMVGKLHRDYRMLAMTDVVFNHTANNSAWLLEHPEAGYNGETAPHLLAAIELDRQLLQFSRDLAALGYPTNLRTVDDLLRVLDGIKTHVLSELKLWEYYVVDVQSTLTELAHMWEKVDAIDEGVPNQYREDLHWIATYTCQRAAQPGFGSLAGRFSNKIDADKFISILKGLYGASWRPGHLDSAHKILDEINLPLYKEYDADIGEILEQLYNRIRYLRLDSNGPQLGPITEQDPLTEPYFTWVEAKDGKQYALANNGWIWNGNPLVDFASEKSKSYLRREVIVWSDCVKLRYGASPHDSPYLWSRMTQYIEMNAKIFDGFRIDNCHSTPLHVGEYFLDLAREINPNLYVAAELFSGDEALDCLYVERLAISSLIREAMQAWSEEELSRIVHRHGGRPIGSYKYMPLTYFSSPKEGENYNGVTKSIDNEYTLPVVCTATAPHALFMDCTHDNETPYQKRTLQDTLPTAALVAFCSSAIGSVYGYDEIFPRLLDVVTEDRTYSVVEGDGISMVKAQLSNIRKLVASSMGDIEDSEMHVHHDGQYITFHRTNSKTVEGWFLVARSKFREGDPEQRLPDITLAGVKCELEFSYALEQTGDVPDDNGKVILGIPTRLSELSGFEVKYEPDSNVSTISMPGYFPQGSIAVFKTSMVGMDDELEGFISAGITRATQNLNLYSLNSVLYRCKAEEMDRTGNKNSVYNIPGYGDLVYCGLQGWVSVLKDIIPENNLAHPLSEHLRNGTWAPDYIVNSLDWYNNEPGVKDIQNWFRTKFERIKSLPYYLIPRYFALVVGIAYVACHRKAMSLMTNTIGTSTMFIQQLAMVSVQMVSNISSASLLPDRTVPSMAAGLPHFSTHYMRCWGRDVFISLRGLLLVTGRFEDAKMHILAFAKTLKHGLIPNLLAAGKDPRYNARDAAWFFIQSIQDYISIVPNGEQILEERVTRRFPLDDTYIPYDDPAAFSYSSSIRDIIFEILSRHALGIKYREANAGPRLDSVMSDRGFNVEIHVDWSTGLIHGGSQYNCGTWMDKMGESKLAGTYGVPGTPRDGAAVEINGLLKSALRFVLELHSRGLFPHTAVPRADGSLISFVAWNDLLQANFERKFYVPEDPSEDSSFDIDPSLVNRRGIYKDLCHSGKPYEDYQLRPNFTIAMTVAPELFSPQRAQRALAIADRVIRGPVGMRTLDPSDYNYYPDYNNGQDSTNPHTARGRNYHQGPEWIWCYGYFLRAYARFSAAPASALHQRLQQRLRNHRTWLVTSPWAGLTELTNRDGAYCHDSSPTQAWSASCLLDLLYDV